MNGRPIALWQGPFGPALGAVLAYGAAADYVVDDVDNAGILRSAGATTASFDVVRATVLRRGGWSNVRPVFGGIPDGLLWPNAARLKFGQYGQLIQWIAAEQGTNGDRFVRAMSERYGFWTLCGPDRAIAGVTLGEVQDCLFSLMRKGLEAIERSIPDRTAAELACERMRELLAPSGAGSLGGYSATVIRRFARLCGESEVRTVSLLDWLEANPPTLLRRFAAAERSIYNECARKQGSKQLEPGELPYYTVRRSDGLRRFQFPSVAQGEVIVPKVLVLENLGTIALPHTLSSKPSIVARTEAYHALKTGTSHSYYKLDPFPELQRSQLPVRVAPPWRCRLNANVAPIGKVAGAILQLEREFHELTHTDRQRIFRDASPDEAWSMLVACSTAEDARFNLNLPLYYAALGKEFLRGIRADSATQE